eukprot:scaffold247_cov274-Pinguiococcus_pyrenoidosus.AAC.3
MKEAALKLIECPLVSKRHAKWNLSGDVLPVDEGRLAQHCDADTAVVQVVGKLVDVLLQVHVVWVVHAEGPAPGEEP